MAAVNQERRKVVIIGAGVSGSSTAIRLLKEGITPLVLDKAYFPREVVGEGLSPIICEYLRELDVLEEINSGPFLKKSSLQLVSPDGSVAYAQVDFNQEIYNSGKHQEPWGFNVKRKDFDMVLFNKAKELGADIREGVLVKEILTDDNGAVNGLVILNENKVREVIKTPLIIDCSGRSSRLAAQFNLRTPLENIFQGQWANYAVRCYFKNINFSPLVRENSGYDLATVNIIPYSDCWYWIIPLEEDLFSIGFVARSKSIDYLGNRKEKGSLQEYRELIARHPVLKEVIKDAEMLDNVITTSRLGHMNTRMAGKGFMCVGDAGFFADPAWATGVTVALITSKEAAKVAVSAILDNDFSEDRLAKYEERYRNYLKDPFNSIRAYNIYYNDMDYVNYLVKELADNQQDMHLINAVLFDYTSHKKFNEWTYKMFKKYVSETGNLPEINKVSQLDFEQGLSK